MIELNKKVKEWIEDYATSLDLVQLTINLVQETVEILAWERQLEAREQIKRSLQHIQKKQNIQRNEDGEFIVNFRKELAPNNSKKKQRKNNLAVIKSLNTYKIGKDGKNG